MNALLSFRLRSPDRNRSAEREADQIIRNFQGETAAITEAPDPVSARITVWIFASMVAIFLFLSCVLSIDRVVEAEGRVEAQTPTLVVQPLETSLIRAIHVREGQVVRKGDILITLDPTFATADVSQIDQQIDSLSAEIARLEAEAQGIPFKTGENPSQDMILQETIWRARQAEDKAKLTNYDQRMATADETIRRATQEASHYRSRVKVLSNIEGMRQELERNKVGSRLNSLLATDSLLDVQRSLAAAETTAQSAKHELEALRAERDVYIKQRRSTILSDLSTRQLDLAKATEDQTKARRRHELIELRAVDDAVVLEIGKVSVGSVVQTGDKLLTLVPAETPMEVVVAIPALDQGHVKVGDEAQIKFAAYRYMEHGMGRGVVRSISEDSFTHNRDQTQSSAPYFRAHIDLTDVSLRNVPSSFRLVPGMPVTADIMVGSRRIISYFAELAVKASSEGMREP